MSDDKGGVLAAMYGDDPEQEADDAAQRRAKWAADEVRRAGRSAVIRIEGKEVEVPTLAYVRKLERAIEDSQRTISRMESTLRDAARLVNRQAQEIASLRSEISRSKWDV